MIKRKIELLKLNNLSEKYPDVVNCLSGKVLTWQKAMPESQIDREAGMNSYPWPE